MIAQGLGDLVVGPHLLAVQAGMDVLAAGGNAVDAAIAVNAVQGVVAPETCGIGGDLFALVHQPEVEIPHAINASGPAGSNADLDELRGEDRIPPFHPLSVTVPGCVAGWEHLSQRFGSLPLSDLLVPAIRLAHDGFPASRELCRAFAARDLSGHPSGAEMYPGGSPPGPGEIIRRPLLARTLETIADQGSAGFYQGPIADAISKAVDGRITLDDLASYQPEWVQPIGTTIYGRTAWTVPPNSQGYLTLATLLVFIQTDPPDDPSEPVWWHSLIEAYRSVVWERSDLAADPRFTGLDPSSLLDPARLADRASRIRPDAAVAWPNPGPSLGGTAYMCVVDRNGWGVSLIQSNFWGVGSGIGAGNTGILLHNRGAGFGIHAGDPNRLEPGKRPLHTLSPTLWTLEGRLAGLLGTRGGDQQPQLLAQMAARVFGSGQDPDVAQAAPRWWMDLDTGVIRVEADTPDEVVRGLRRRGHSVEEVAPRMSGWGPVSIITVDSRGVRTGAPDPRVDTAAAAAR
ncbi:MAG: gamma-glutamyltransferase [Acidimicrobiia bacterium]|nr:MAG: gamma-glutamyltransferase [Acidimicrobiia bacterium]